MKKTITLLFLIPFLAGCVAEKPYTESPETATSETVISEYSDDGIINESADNTAESVQPVIYEQEFDSSGWLTYKNEELGFQVKYPEWVSIAASEKYGIYSVISFNDPSLENGGFGWTIVSEDKTEMIRNVIKQEAEYLLQSYADSGYINRNKVSSDIIQEIITETRTSGLISDYSDWKEEMESVVSLVEDIVVTIDSPDSASDEIYELGNIINDVVEERKYLPLSSAVGYKYADAYDYVTYFYSLQGITDYNGRNKGGYTETMISDYEAAYIPLKNSYPAENGNTDLWGSDNIFIETGDRIYFITGDGSSYNDLFQIFCDSFEFLIPEGKEKTDNTNSDEIAEWKIYKNDEYGFELKYPENWYFDGGESYGHFNVNFGNHEPGTYDCRIDCPDDFQIYHINIYSKDSDVSKAHKCSFDSTRDCLSSSDEIYKYDVGNGYRLISYVRLREADNLDITVPIIRAYLEDDEYFYSIFSSGRYSSENSRLAVEVLEKSLSTFRLTD